jgi:hypothetical protein
MKREIVSEKVMGDYKVRTFIDESPESPREWDNMGTMVCFHGRYNLGDKTDYRSEDYSSWEDLKKGIIENEGECFILPLYLYDHSGITISTSPFSCNWDSGQVGFIFVSKHVVKNYGVDETKVEEYLKGEVGTYDTYLRGEVYGFEVVKVTKCNLGHEHEEVIETHWGYYDEDECFNEGTYIVRQEKELV